MLNKILKKISRTIYVKNDLIFLKKEANSQNPLNLQIGLTIKKINRTDILIIKSKYKKKLQNELESGSTIYGIFLNDELAHFSCLSKELQKIGEINRSFRVPKNSVYIYNCFTFEKYRGKGLFPLMLNYIFLNYQQDLYIAVLKNNLASYKVIKKLGFKEIGYVNYVKNFFYERFNISKLLLNNIK